MPVIPLTLVISLCLTATFIIFFIREHGRRRFSSAESDALLPLAGETSRVAAAGPLVIDLEGRRSAKAHLRRGCGGNHRHDDGHEPCGDCANCPNHDHDHV